MRSSPSSLVESRSSGDVQGGVGKVDPKGPSKLLHLKRPDHTGKDDGAEVTVHLRVGYKTVLLVVVIFDLVHLSVRELLHTGWLEQLF